MTLTATSTSTALSDNLVRRAHEAAARLEEVPFYARLLEGAVTRDEYAQWLVQMHKFIRCTTPALRGLVTATSGARAEQPELSHYALKEAREEAGHDDLILRDLAALWRTSVHEALGRVERAPTSPAAATWQALLDTLIARYPEGIIGTAIVLELIASLHADRTRVGLLARDPSLDGAVAFLGAHRAEVEEAHNEEGREQVDRLVGARARSAAFYYGCGALALFEGVTQYLDERLSAVDAAD